MPEPLLPARPEEPDALSPEDVRLLIETQMKSVENRRLELQLTEQQQNKSFDLARMSLEAEREDRKDRRAHSRKQTQTRFGVLLAALILICSLAGFALYKDQPSIAMEIVKAVLYIIPAFVGGYGVRSILDKQHDEPIQGPD